MNRGIMSGMEPVRLKDGGFPDLTGDGKVTQKDILRGRGIEGFADGGQAGEEGIKYFGKDGLILDPYNPLDLAMAIPGLGQVGMGIKFLSTANKLRKLNKAAEKVSKLSNPVTNTLGGGAFLATVAPEIKDFITEDYTDPTVAYLNEDNGNYYYYDPEKDDYDYFPNNQVPEGYTLEQ